MNKRNWQEQIGKIMRIVTMTKPKTHSHSLREAIKRVDTEATAVKKAVGGQTNTDILLQMLEKIK